MKHILMIIAGCLSLFVMGGCPHDLWTANYRPNPAAITAKNVGMDTPAQIRKCTPEQVQEASATEQKYLDEHKLAREDETLEDQRRIHAEQFPIFRVRDSADTVVLLGECAFSYDEPISDNDPFLIRLGQRKGASFILLCLYPPQQTDNFKLNVSQNAWGGGASWGPSGEWSVAAQFYRRLTAEDHEQLNAKSSPTAPTH